MRRKILMVFSCLFCIFLFSCQKENRLLPENTILIQVLAYGNLTETVPYDTIEIYEYNKHGKISKVLVPGGYNLFTYNSIGQLINKSEYVINLNAPTGYLNLKTYYYSYSRDGKIEKESIGDLSGYITEYSQYVYTEDRLTKIEKYNNNSGELIEFTEYTIDDYGQPINEIKYFGNHTPYRWTINSFSNRLMVKTEIFTDQNLENRLREIKRTFGVNRNIIILESTGRAAFESYVLRYEYY